MKPSIEEVEKLMEAGENLRLRDVHFYTGVFTGKLVKRETLGGDDFKHFSKGDRVFVFDFEEYQKFYAGIELILETINNLKTDGK